MGLESLEIVLSLEDEFDIKFEEGELFYTIFTVGDLFHAVLYKMGIDPSLPNDGLRDRCTQRGAEIVREDLARLVNRKLESIDTNESLDDLFPVKKRKSLWNDLIASSNWKYAKLVCSKAVDRWIGRFGCIFGLFCLIGFITCIVLKVTTETDLPIFTSYFGVVIVWAFVMNAVGKYFAWHFPRIYRNETLVHCETVGDLAEMIAARNITAILDEFPALEQSGGAYGVDADPLRTPGFDEHVQNRVFHALADVTGRQVEEITLDSRLAQLLPPHRRAKRWKQLLEEHQLGVPLVESSLDWMYSWAFWVWLALLVMFIAAFLQGVPYASLGFPLLFLGFPLTVMVVALSFQVRANYSFPEGLETVADLIELIKERQAFRFMFELQNPEAEGESLPPLIWEVVRRIVAETICVDEKEITPQTRFKDLGI